MAMIFVRTIGATAPITGRAAKLAFFLIVAVLMMLVRTIRTAAPIG